MIDIRNNFINREVSWLYFNERVLQEATDPSTPLIERIRFLSIFSSNLDEFYRVRVASVKRMMELNTTSSDFMGQSPRAVYNEISDMVIRLRNKFEHIFDDIFEHLKEQKIFILNEKELDDEQGKFVRKFFHEKIRINLFPIKLDNLRDVTKIRDKIIYLAVQLSSSQKKIKTNYALVEIPTETVERFIILPQKNDNKFIILLDDVIRYCLNDIFSCFGYDRFEAYTIKVTRDAEFDLENDLSKSFIEQMSASVKQRKLGRPVRFIYDEKIPKGMLKSLLTKLHISGQDNMIPGGRYHNSKDFILFPNVGSENLLYPPIIPIPHKDLDTRKSLIEPIRKKDIMLHYPYQSFDYIIDLLREASLDPNVVSIKMTLYRLAKHSSIVNALINSARNGKQVTVFIEIQARFDEEANIKYLTMMQDEGIRVIQGVPGMKVHAKLCLIKRLEGKKNVLYANVSTGNFNGVTSKQYCDDSLLTADKRITQDVEKVFEFLEDTTKEMKFDHLMVSPMHLRNQLRKLILKEIEFAKKKKKAEITLKLNNLVDPEMVRLLLEASNAGVKVHLLIRGTCVLKTSHENFSKNIEAFSIVDRFLEHSRIYVFHNGGDEKVFISSADLMQRNFDHRVEVACPIFDKKIITELKNLLKIQFNDNVKIRTLNSDINRYRRADGKKRVRAQHEIYNYLQSIHKK